ncbi:MAG TPA: hypothetical protein VFQ74_11555 [Pseudolysinimonas sp.]|nr:hypothetical protein [Pseudolysinimonas sp.]
MTERGGVVGDAAAALSERGWGIREAPQHVASMPGLYAIHATAVTWEELGLPIRLGVPLYVGKSEGSLVTRELEGHFASNPEKPARTGNSTVRRSFASLLRMPLQLSGRPRGHARKSAFSKADFTNYELDVDGDQRLTAWMHRQLRLSVWVMPVDLILAELGRIEVALIQRWTPPINIRDLPRKDPRLAAARRQMAAEARTWRS